eukprot:7917666-Pyramimonas_sp.AAC.1
METTQRRVAQAAAGALGVRDGRAAARRAVGGISNEGHRSSVVNAARPWSGSIRCPVAARAASFKRH